MNWFAAKVRYQTEKKIKVWFEEQSIEHYIPVRKIMVEKDGKRVEKEKILIPGLLFIHTDYQKALSLSAESRIKMVYMRNLENHRLLVVPDKQMQDFMFLLDFSETTIQIENTSLRQGDRVRVVKGEFAGIEGELIRIKGHKRVVIRLEGLFSVATTYIPSSYLERI